MTNQSSYNGSTTSMTGGYRSGNMVGIGQHLAMQQNQQQNGYQNAGNTNGVLRP